MIYENTLTTSFDNSNYYTIKGCERLYLIDSAYFRGYRVENRQAKNLDYTGSFKLFEKLNSLSFTVRTENSKNGTLYSIELNLSVSGLRADVTYLMDSLKDSEYTAIVQDSNGRFFLLGFGQGLRGAYEYNTEDSSYTCKLQTKQVARVEEVAYSSITSMTLASTYQGTTPNPVYSNPQVVTTTPVTGSNTKNTTLVTTNYTVTSTDQFLKVLGAYTVTLPIAPVAGQELTIKAVYDASEALKHVRIVPSGTALIDGETEFKINTEYGFVTLVYQGGQWSVTSL